MIIIVTLIAIFNIMTSLDTTTSPGKASPTPQPTDRRVSSQSLLGKEGRVIIEHDGHQYLLRQTHAGKLILTK
ncbi:hemin uptake protein HemP [Scandinavium sp. V105_16]|uniref:Hemin uptake protein HemP n=1 Tax=Scandinavium lactucae TaxID=3095028 RepID=A0AAJ2VWI8_9ENTR|nr:MULTISPECIES: hemin uptake protein HemP [unclassified Scandinavium]MDX6020870.1 hemin uptake protein HemP [Scandinavium sp. V105_16]MDX6030908.1 hemin uptake protein HemP [Scandinavium sp. V105_12]